MSLHRRRGGRLRDPQATRQFEPETLIQAGVGEAGALIPPFEYHVLANALDTPAVTIHIYGGEMNHCHIFVPAEGGFLRQYRELSYTA